MPKPPKTCDSFRITTGNHLAVAAASVVASLPGGINTPLILEGPRGCGKSHLLQALVHETLSRHPKGRVRSFVAEDFFCPEKGPLKEWRRELFRDGIASVEVALIDQIENLAKDFAAVETLFRFLAACHQIGGQVVLAYNPELAPLEGFHSRMVRECPHHLWVKMRGA